VTNSGNVALDTVPLSDTYLTNLLSIVSQTPFANSTNLGAGSLSWTNLGPLAAGGSVTVTARFTSILSGTGTNVALSAPVTTNGVPVNPVTSSVPHTAFAPGIAIAKTVTSPTNRPAAIGEQVQFTITATNTGNTVLDTVPLSDTFNTNLLSFVSATPANNAFAGNLISWTNIGPLGINSSTSVIVRFTALTNGIGTNGVVTIPTTTNGIPVPPKTNEVPHTNVNPHVTIAKALLSPSGRPAAIGEQFAFTLTVLNDGNVALDTVPVSDSYSTNLISYISSVPATVDNNNDGLVNWTNVGPIAAGSSVTITSRFTAVLAGTGTNAAVTVPTTTNGVPVPPSTSTVPHTAVAPSVAITKTVVSPSGRAAAVGEQFVFAIAITNTGNVALDTVPLVDTYNTNLLAIVSQTPGANSTNLPAGTISWTNVGSLAVGGSTVVTTRFTAVAAGTGTNAVTTSPVTTNGVPVPPATSSVPHTATAPGIALFKTVTSPAGRAAAIGETVIFTVVATNSGNITLDTVPLTDTYNTNLLSILSQTAPASSTNLAAGSLGWTNIGPLTAGGTASVTVRFTALTNGVGTNVVVTVPTTTNGIPVPPTTNSVPHTNVNPRVTIAKTLTSPSGRPAAVGETNVFTLLVSNTGNIPLDTVPVTDTFDSTKMTFVSAVPAVNTTNANSVVWTNAGPLAAGSSTSLTVRFLAISSGTGTNTGLTAPTTTNGVPVPPATSSVPHTTVAPSYVLAKTLVSPSGRPAAVGELFVFAIAVTNTGNIPLDAVPLTDTFNTTLMTFVSASPTQNTVVGNTIIWSNIGPLNVGGSTVVTARFTAASAGTDTNIAVTIPTTTNGVPVVPSTSTAPHTAVAPNVTITKLLASPSGRPTAVGETNVFTITVFNGGAIALDTVPVVDTYNTNLLSIVSQTPFANSTNLGAGTLSWTNIGPLGIGNSAVITARFVTVANGTGTNVALSTPSTTNGVPVPPVTSSVPHTAVTPNIAIVKVVSSPTNRPAAIGEQVQFTITATNSGNVLLDAVPLSDTFNTNLLSFVSATPPQNSLAGNLLSWTDIGPLGAGSTTSVIVRFTALTNGIGTNRVVTIPTTTNGIPVPPKTNEVPHTNVNPHVTIAKTVLSPAGRPAALGEQFFFALTVLNDGNVPLDTVPVSDTFNTNFISFVSAAPAPNATGPGSLSWTNVGPLLAGQSTVITARFNTVTFGTETNRAVTTPTTTNGVPVPPSTSSVPHTVVTPGVVVTKTLANPLGRSAVVGEPVTFNIVVTNTGNIRLDTVPLVDTYLTNLLTASSQAAPANSTNLSAGTLTWTNVGPLNVGGSAALTVTFIAANAGSGTNFALVSPTTTNGVPVVPSTSSASHVAVTASFTVVKSLITPTGRPAAVGETITFTITVSNTSPITLSPVPLTDVFDPAVLAFQSASVAPNQTNANSLIWTNVGPLNVGGSITITTRFTAVGTAILTPTVSSRPESRLARVELRSGQPASQHSNDWKFEVVQVPMFGKSGIAAAFGAIQLFDDSGHPYSIESPRAVYQWRNTSRRSGGSGLI
jgi:uncharacterized repeat protein (TIGR01451 family)